MNFKKNLAFAFLVAWMALPTACSSTDSNTDSGEGAAEIGVPSTPFLGDIAFVAAGQEFRFKDRAGQVRLVRKGTGDNPLSLENDTFGPALNRASDQHYGWYSNTPWKCRDAEVFATTQATSPDPNQLCYVEINPTGGTGFSFSIIGLDANGQGLRTWTGSPGDVPAAVNGGTPQPITAGPPRTVNVTLDADAIADAIKTVQDHFNTDTAERNDCLKNALTGSWLDAQAHYYCSLPYNEIRTCYSGRLIAASQDPNPTVRATAPVAAYDACFKNATSGESQWLHQNQEAAFKYVMFTKQGTFDFDIDSENKAINDYYQKRGEKRPRRLVDTYPEWLADQPRYHVIRKNQYAAQNPSSGTSSGSSGSSSSGSSSGSSP
jgi:hypothetical protein